MEFNMLYLSDYIDGVDRKRFKIPEGNTIYYTKIIFDYDYMNRWHCVKVEVVYQAKIRSYTKHLWFKYEHFIEYYKKCENYQRFKKIKKINNLAA